MRYEGLRPNFDRKMLRESGPWTTTGPLLHQLHQIFFFFLPITVPLSYEVSTIATLTINEKIT